MTERHVLRYPDPRLREKAKEVAEITDEIKTLVDDMFETMYKDNGVGLAATQLGVAHRVITIDVSTNRSKPLCLINPEIISRDGTTSSDEGCLSVPGIFIKVDRAAHIRFRALDREGKAYEMDASGLLSCCVQHECDHIDGILVIDKLSPIKRQRAEKKLEKLKRHIL